MKEGELSVIHPNDNSQINDTVLEDLNDGRKAAQSNNTFFGPGEKTFILGEHDVTLDKDVFETILKDIYATHKAEVDMLKLELAVYKRALKKSLDKIKDKKI